MVQLIVREFRFLIIFFLTCMKNHCYHVLWLQSIIITFLFRIYQFEFSKKFESELGAFSRNSVI